MRFFRSTLGLVVALGIFVWALPQGFGANSTAMPQPAPAFNKQNSVDTNCELPSFRVQTAAPSSLTANVSQDVVSLKSSVIKTSPAQHQGMASVPPEAFRAWLEQAHPKFALSASTIDPETLLEVKGMYDNSSKTLRSLGIPFRQIRGGELEDIALNGVKVMVVNCPGRVPRESLQKVRDFVARGGYLLSTDWSSDNLIEQAFPGYIQWDGHSNRDSIYDAEIVNGDSPIFARTVSNATWKMDVDSHMIRKLRNDVRVLAMSHQLAGEDAACGGILAALFPFGRGYVMHMVGHFDNNTILPFRNMLADPAPVIGISLRQALAANFVVAGLTGERLLSR